MKILVLSESVAGSGHVVAAENISKGIKVIYPSATIKVDTGLPQISPLLEKVMSEAYMKTIRHASPLWGWAYTKDREWSWLGKRWVQKFVANKLEPYVAREKPDIVICTHAFCLGGLCELKKRFNPSFRLGASLTDYSINHFWVFEEVDYYFVGSESLKKKMNENYGISSSKIHVTGIPIDPVYSAGLDRTSIREQFSIPIDTFLVLISGGGMGIAPYEEVLKTMKNVTGPLFITVILGRNDKKREAVEKVAATLPHPTLILDYVQNMREWMSAADFMIGKPGGLTVSEALSCELPLIVYKPIPGQEEKNSRFLLDHQVARRADGMDELKRVIQETIEGPDQLEGMKERVRALGRPDSALEVGRIIMNDVIYYQK